MDSFEVQDREHGSEQVYVVASYRDADNVVDGLPAAVRMGVLQGVLRALEQGRAEGPEHAQRHRDTVDLVAYEILFALVRQRKLVWGVESKAAREARRFRAFSDPLPRQPAHPAAAPYLLDLVDWSAVEPWLASLNYPREMRARYRALKESLFERGPWLSSWRLHWHVLRRLHEMWKPERAEVEEGAWLRSLQRRQIVTLESVGVLYRNRSLGKVLEYYGVGQRARVAKSRGYHVAFWRIQHILYRMQQEGGLDLRSLPWMAGRYWLIEDLPRLPVGDFPLDDPGG